MECQNRFADSWNRWIQIPFPGYGGCEPGRQQYADAYVCSGGKTASGVDSGFDVGPESAAQVVFLHDHMSLQSMPRIWGGQRAAAFHSGLGGKVSRVAFFHETFLAEDSD